VIDSSQQAMLIRCPFNDRSQQIQDSCQGAINNASKHCNGCSILILTLPLAFYRKIQLKKAATADQAPS
jgi:hypothetical protein